MSREDEIRQGLYDSTLNGRAADVKALTVEALALGLAPLDILYGPLIPALEEVGRLFEEGTYFVPEMLIAAKAMKAAMVPPAPGVTPSTVPITAPMACGLNKRLVMAQFGSLSLVDALPPCAQGGSPI